MTLLRDALAADYLTFSGARTNQGAVWEDVGRKAAAVGAGEDVRMWGPRVHGAALRVGDRLERLTVLWHGDAASTSRSADAIER